MSMRLFLEAILKFLLGIVLVALLIFLPAGTINYFNGWLFMGLLFIPMFVVGIIMLIKSPELLKKRLNFSILGIFLFKALLQSLANIQMTTDLLLPFSGNPILFPPYIFLATVLDIIHNPRK